MEQIPLGQLKMRTCGSEQELNDIKVCSVSRIFVLGLPTQPGHPVVLPYTSYKHGRDQIVMNFTDEILLLLMT